MRTLMTICVTATCWLVAAPVLAQMPFHPWMEGRYLKDMDKTRDNIVRVGPGAGVAFGVDFAPKHGIQVSVDFPEPHVETYETSYEKVHVIHTITNRAPSVSVLYAAHLITTTRVRVTILGGLARVQTPTHGQIITERLGPNGNVVGRETDEGADNYPKGGLGFGADIPVRVFQGLSVVPSVHGVLFPFADYGRDGFLRPSIGVRWTF